MSDLLLEIYGEELPSSAQILGEKQLYQSFLELFTKKKKLFILPLKLFNIKENFNCNKKNIKK